MEHKGKKGGFPRSIFGNLIEAGGEYTGDKLGKLVMENLMDLLPFLENMAAGLGKTGKEMLSLLPYVLTIPVKNELSQDTWQGFMRGLVDVVKNRDTIPDDPAAQKGWFVTHLKPLFDKVKKEGAVGGEKPKVVGFLAATYGLPSARRKNLSARIDEAEMWPEIDLWGPTSTITTEQIDAALDLSNPGARILAQIKPAPKPVSVMDRIQKVTSRLGAEGEKYLDPKSSEWTGAIGQIQAHTNTVDMSLDFITRNTKR